MNNSKNFYTRSVLFVILSLTSAAISYLLYPVLARILNLRELGDYIAIVGLSNQIMGILLAFSVMSIALVGQYSEAEATNNAQIIQKVLLWIFIFLSLITLAVSPILQGLLKIEHVSSFFILSLIMLLSVPSNIWAGFLQGHKEQVRVGISGVCTAIFKFICVLVLATHFGTNGGLLGFWLSSLIGLVVLYYLPGTKVPRLNTIFKPLKVAEKTFLRHNKGYIAQSIFVVGGLVFLQNYDLLLAKSTFSPSIAGVYSGISILSNALYFVAFLLIWILLPEFSITNRVNNLRVLRTAYVLIAALTVIIVAAGLMFGNQILPVLLGQSFVRQSNTLIIASLYQISLVSVALYAFYLLVIRKRRSILLTASVLISCCLIPLAFSSSPFAMVSALLTAVLVGVIGYWLICGLANLKARG